MEKMKWVLLAISSLILAVCSLRAGNLCLHPMIPETGPVGEPPEPDRYQAVLWYIASGLLFISFIIAVVRSISSWVQGGWRIPHD